MMKAPSNASVGFAACRAEYVRLEQALRKQGLNKQSINVSREVLSEFKRGQWWLQREAYAPTGLALGCPLPNPSRTRLFSRLACLVDSWLVARSEDSQPYITFVPPEMYHITVLNRSHYEHSSITLLSKDELVQVKRLVAHLNLKEIKVIASGLVLTADGRLFVKCLPIDKHLFDLRAALAESFPVLHVGIPRTVHVKIGHLRITLPSEDLIAFEAWLKHLDDHILGHLVFNDIYTPAGRFSL